MQDQGKPSIIKTTLMAGIPFGILFSALFNLRHLIRTGDASGFLFTAVVIGIPFGITMAIFARSVGGQKAVQIELPEGETVQYSGAANHFLNAESRGGYLYLTNRNLIFKPHNINVQRQAITIPLGNISKVWPSLSLGIVPNGLSVKTSDGKVNKFVVNQRSVWKKNILLQAAG